MKLIVLIAILSCTFLSVGAVMVSTNHTSIFDRVKFTGRARALANNSEVWHHNFGYANQQFQQPFSSKTTFPIGSNTKVMTAVAIYQLIEAGLIGSEEDSIAGYMNQTDFAAMGYPEMTSYCPKVKGNDTCQVITFKNLLGMSGGIPVNIQEEVLPYPGTMALTIGASIAAELLFVPGTAYYYSNPSFNIAGYLVERISGIPFKDYLQKHIWDPAGMTSTYLDMYNGEFNYDPHHIHSIKQYYDNTTGELLGVGNCKVSVVSGSVQGAGGSVSTLEDESNFYHQLFQLAPGYKSPFFQKASTLQKLLTPVQPIASNGIYYAQGIVVQLESLKAAIPTFIFYMGGTLCSQTANVYQPAEANAENEPRMTQVFSNTETFFTTRAFFRQAAAGEAGSWFSLTGQMQKAPDSSKLASDLFAQVFP